MFDPYWATEYGVDEEFRIMARHTLRLVAWPREAPPVPKGFRRTAILREPVAGGLFWNFTIVDVERPPVAHA